MTHFTLKILFSNNISIDTIEKMWFTKYFIAHNEIPIFPDSIFF